MRWLNHSQWAIVSRILSFFSLEKETSFSLEKEVTIANAIVFLLGQNSKFST